MSRTTTTAACALLAATLLVPASAQAASRMQPVTIDFAARAGSTPIACGTPTPGLGTTKQPTQVKDLRFFVSNVELLRRDGRAVRVKLAKDDAFRATVGRNATTLIDLENGRGSCAEEGTRATNSAVRGTVPRGRYTGVRWTLGLPGALNHTDTTGAPGPLSVLAMGWSWQFGRKMVKIEVTDPAGVPGTWASNTFFVHLGSTGCEGDPALGETTRCAAANRPRLTLKRFDPARQRIAVDVAALLAGNDVTVNDGEAPGCMSFPGDRDCVGVFRALGVREPAGQTTFRAIRR